MIEHKTLKHIVMILSQMLLNVPCLKNISVNEITDWFGCDKNDTDYQKLMNDESIKNAVNIEKLEVNEGYESGIDDPSQS